MLLLLLALAAAQDAPPEPLSPPPPETAPATEEDPSEERVPAALEAEPEPEPAAPAAAPAATTTAPVAGAVEQKRERRIGDPVPLTRREPTLEALQLMVGARYGLVGTGPTRFTDDVRFGITDWLELRTALLPYPSSLMARGRIGSVHDEMGAILLDGGLAHFDAGFRLVPDTGESQVGVRLHFEGGVGYAKALGERFQVHGQAHYRYRMSFLANDDQHAAAVDAHLTYDLLDSLAVSAGLGFATTILTPVRELSIIFVESEQPGMSHLLARDEGGEQSVTIPLTMTYGRVENFDVDLFCTPRIYPELGILFGAGVRLRLDPFGT